MKNNIWETGAFFGVPASFFYFTFVANSSRICGDLCGFIGGFGRFHLDESGEFIKMDGWGGLDEWKRNVLMDRKGHLDEKNMLCFSGNESLRRMRDLFLWYDSGKRASMGIVYHEN